MMPVGFVWKDANGVRVLPHYLDVDDREPGKPIVARILGTKHDLVLPKAKFLNRFSVEGH